MSRKPRTGCHGNLSISKYRAIAKAKAAHAMAQDPTDKAKAAAVLIEHGLLMSTNEQLKSKDLLDSNVDEDEAKNEDVMQEAMIYKVSGPATAKAKHRAISKAKAAYGMAKDPMDKAKAAAVLIEHGLLPSANEELKPKNPKDLKSKDEEELKPKNPKDLKSKDEEEPQEVHEDANMQEAHEATHANMQEAHEVTHEVTHEATHTTIEEIVLCLASAGIVWVVFDAFKA
ncbi:hypothetical protein SEMRO_3611_G349660.1 [Seminavis robusta]|uniref:Uncharacterized protein n=1 Tax=Seminavis robusta TaxID=568900 RepID=A0A9N8HY40_9STRA|nr:hypothetical protein SEMRO_3611_G349660.1 [Seminavis robusta]|eukprot:Sro3611_g349660.1 n/a (229) ;mRNA; f:708-1394